MVKITMEIPTNVTINELQKISEEKTNSLYAYEIMLAFKLGISGIELCNYSETRIFINNYGSIWLQIAETQKIDEVLSDMNKHIKIKWLDNYVPEKAGIFKDFIESKFSKEEGKTFSYEFV